jgi:hypothetical protein
LVERSHRGGRCSIRTFSSHSALQSGCPLGVLLRGFYDHQWAATHRRIYLHEEIDAGHLFGPTPAHLRNVFACPHPVAQSTAAVFLAFVVEPLLARLSDARDFGVMESSESQNEKNFFPSGAIFFFALLIAFYAALWLVVYWIMVVRA